MQQVLLGKSKLRVSRMGYGCWRLAGSEGQPPPADAEAVGIRAVLAAVDAGYTLFDLADIYGGGRCEEIFGSALRQRPGLRNQIVVASKCGIRKGGAPGTGSPYRYDSSGDYIVESVEGSLRRLGIETLDLLMIHRPDYLMNPGEVAGAFARLRDAGKVREFGVSNFRPTQWRMLQRACPFPLVVNQIEISLRRLDALEDGTLDDLMAEGVIPMAWSPLARGALVDAGGAELDSPDVARRAALGDCLGDIARARGVSRAAVALGWLLQHPAGIIPVIGSVRPERIQDAITADSLPLSREEWYRLIAAARGARLP
ncbi:MAG: aldo/keto reductase [Verrucomicrobiales bacterium]|nr:aldo/keto reductase [Verrucomicrobiales bacterium]